MQTEIRIQKLTPDLVQDYVKFFDDVPHDDNRDENKCYCVCWCSADHRVETDFSSREKRRALAVAYVENEIIQGYLAYSGDRVVGWCNANTKADCRNCTSWLRFMQAVDAADTLENKKVKSVFCFVIAPDMRKKGVAGRLLDAVVEDAAKDGFDVVEAYPNREYVSEARDFMGPRALYDGRGFVARGEAGDKIIMRKWLK